jgi:hypothetical protein
MPALALSALALSVPARAQDNQAAELAKKLANPVASLISVPLQYNYDEYGGANDGAAVSRLVIQPVIPFSLNEDWNLITRTLVPLIDQQDFPIERLNESGLGNITPSFFFSPKAPTASSAPLHAVHRCAPHPCHARITLSFQWRSQNASHSKAMTAAQKGVTNARQYSRPRMNASDSATSSTAVVSTDSPTGGDTLSVSMPSA